MEFKEILSIGKIKGLPFSAVSHLRPAEGGGVWAILPRERAIHLLNPSGEATSTIGPSSFDEALRGFVPHKLDLDPKGRLVVSDLRNGIVACFDRHGGLAWSSRVKTPPGSDDVAWAGFPEYARRLPPSPSSVLVLPGEIWVADQRLQLIYRLGPNGAPNGYYTHYRKGEDRWRFRRIGELERVSGGRILVTFPLARKALVVDEKLQVESELVGARQGRAGGFLGLHGVQYLRGEGVLLTDPATGALKVYDDITGEPVQEVKTPILTRPNMAVRSGEELLWVYVAGENRIAVLRREKARTSAGGEAPSPQPSRRGAGEGK